ncbi:uncharacterized protein P884DRAFT_260450 [Thermothelomyces heterothallicus CBS 202.75]|uniref:uncharacterized protein n=1 Tax=Thermothelomyces heterothallicus CBS 202.75 TaxID=1149848 RepID=UPI0037424383
MGAERSRECTPSSIWSKRGERLPHQSGIADGCAQGGYGRVCGEKDAGERRRRTWPLD